MGGLAAAIRLRAMGFEVELFEKNDRMSGRMGRLEGAGVPLLTIGARPVAERIAREVG